MNFYITTIEVISIGWPWLYIERTWAVEQVVRFTRLHGGLNFFLLNISQVLFCGAWKNNENVMFPRDTGHTPGFNLQCKHNKNLNSDKFQLFQ